VFTKSELYALQIVEITAANQNASYKRVKTCETSYSNHDRHNLKIVHDIIDKPLKPVNKPVKPICKLKIGQVIVVL